jgi:hypothetical protein
MATLTLFEKNSEGMVASFNAEGCFLIPTDQGIGRLSWLDLVNALDSQGAGATVEIEGMDNATQDDDAG